MWRPLSETEQLQAIARLNREVDAGRYVPVQRRAVEFTMDELGDAVTPAFMQRGNEIWRLWVVREAVRRVKGPQTLATTDAEEDVTMQRIQDTLDAVADATAYRTRHA